MKMIPMTAARTACLALAALATTAWSTGRAQAPATYTYTLMVNLVGPPANTLWEMVGAQSLSEPDWERMKQVVARLTESAAAVSAGGTSTEEAERAKSNEWQNWAAKLVDTASAASRAADRKDQAALLAASDTLVEVCEGCHTAFPPATQ